MVGRIYGMLTLTASRHAGVRFIPEIDQNKKREWNSLVKNTNGNIADSSNYRGITLSPIISKIFECLMMDRPMVKDKLISSDLQFGFKSNSSCSHAILALQAGVKHIM